MGTKRIGLARIEALLENLKREIDWGAAATFQGANNIEKVAVVDNTTAFVRNADSEATWTQPANTLITGISILFPSAAYSTGTGNNLGVGVGTASGGGQIVTEVVDHIIDAGADGTDLASGAKLEVTLVSPAASATTLATNPSYTTSARTVHLNTLCDNAAAVTTAGTARWIIKYIDVSGPNVS